MTREASEKGIGAALKRLWSHTSPPSSREIKLNNDTGLLKLVACLAMLSDHMGKMIFPNAWRPVFTGEIARMIATSNIMRMVGRLAFPLFAYCAAVGVIKTRNVWKYALRLLLMGILVHPLYQEAMGHVQLGAFNWAADFWRVDRIYSHYYTANLNIFFSLALGVLITGSAREKKYFLIPILAALTWILRGRLDYGYKGFTLIALFYAFIDRPVASLLAVVPYMLWWCSPALFDSFTLRATTQLYAMGSLLLIYIPVKKRRVVLPKWFFYGFYPAHLLLILLLQVL
ncbi:MAG: conjugal transfer protein TraX [Clostridiales bacterium]|nr:conjugal transfer protein TraX [Clostridiales bacterium]